MWYRIGWALVVFGLVFAMMLIAGAMRDYRAYDRQQYQDMHPAVHYQPQHD